MNEVSRPGDGTVHLHLYGGERAIIDEADLDLAQQYHWCAYRRAKNTTTYVHGSFRVDGVQRNISLHRLLMDFPEGLTIDHINHNGLDNRRANLRVATRGENLGNRRSFNKHGFKGITLKPERWVAHGRDGNQKVHLGLFRTKEEAARAYDRWAHEKWGEFACLNFPEEIHTLQV